MIKNRAKKAIISFIIIIFVSTCFISGCHKTIDTMNLDFGSVHNNENKVDEENTEQIEEESTESEDEMVFFESGTIDVSTGMEFNSTTRLRSDYILSACDLYISDLASSNVRIYYYDTEKNLLYVKDYNEDRNIQFNGYVRFVLYKQNSTAYTSTEITKINEEFQLLKRENQLPDYWQSYMVEKYQTINGRINICEGNGDSMIFITDVHYENNNLYSPLLIKSVMQNTGIENLVVGGDIMHGKAEKVKAFGMFKSWLSMIEEKPYAIALGNHDSNTSINGSTTENSISNSELYEASIKQFDRRADTEDKTYYYFDNKQQKIRYFILNSGDGYSTEDSVMVDPIDYSEQLSWLFTKAGELDSSWNIVVITHMFFAPQTVTSGLEITIGTSKGRMLIETLDLIQSNASMPMVFAVISGHIHRDFSMLTESGYYCISTTCDAGGSSSEVYDKYTPNREFGTTTEQAFDVFQFDLKNKSIYATRIGAGQDREWHY